MILQRSLTKHPKNGSCKVNRKLLLLLIDNAILKPLQLV